MYPVKECKHLELKNDILEMCLQASHLIRVLFGDHFVLAQERRGHGVQGLPRPGHEPIDDGVVDHAGEVKPSVKGKQWGELPVIICVSEPIFL